MQLFQPINYRSPFRRCFQGGLGPLARLDPPTSGLQFQQKALKLRQLFNKILHFNCRCKIFLSEFDVKGCLVQNGFCPKKLLCVSLSLSLRLCETRLEGLQEVIKLSSCVYLENSCKYVSTFCMLTDKQTEKHDEANRNKSATFTSQYTTAAARHHSP